MELGRLFETTNWSFFSCLFSQLIITRRFYELLGLIVAGHTLDEIREHVSGFQESLPRYELLSGRLKLSWCCLKTRVTLFRGGKLSLLSTSLSFTQ
jgi:hypothetical protein